MAEGTMKETISQLDCKLCFEKILLRIKFFMRFDCIDSLDPGNHMSEKPEVDRIIVS